MVELTSLSAYDTLAVVKDIPTATALLATLNEADTSGNQFYDGTVANNNKLLFTGMELVTIKICNFLFT